MAATITRQLDAVRLGRKTLRVKVESIERLVDERPVDIGHCHSA